MSNLSYASGATPKMHQSETNAVDEREHQQTDFSIVNQTETIYNRKHCFYRFLIRFSRLFRSFSISASPL